MTKYRSPDQVAVTSTSQTVELYESHINHTLRNVGTTDIYWHSDVDITAASLLTKTAAQLRTAGCSLLKAGECNTIETRNVMLTVVCANGVTGTLDIEPGAISSPVTVDANIGNVGILNAAETEIDPAKNESEGQTIVYADLPSNATTAATAEQVIAAVASEKFYVLEVSLTFTTQDTVRLLEKHATPVYWSSWHVAARGGIYLPRNATDKPHFVMATAGNNLGIETAANNNYAGHIVYYTA